MTSELPKVVMPLRIDYRFCPLSFLLFLSSWIISNINIPIAIKKAPIYCIVPPLKNRKRPNAIEIEANKNIIHIINQTSMEKIAG